MPFSALYLLMNLSVEDCLTLLFTLDVMLIEVNIFMECKFKSYNKKADGTVCEVPFCKVTDGECQFIALSECCEISAAFCDLDI